MPPHRRPWADLPVEILELVADRTSFADHALFGAVCRSWRSAVSARLHFRSLPLPWLVLPPYLPSSSAATSAWSVVSLSERRPHCLPPISPAARCFGCSLGWLLVANPTHGNHLFHPSAGQSLPLPNAATFPREGIGCVAPGFLRSSGFFYKGVLSARPADPACFVAAIINCSCLAYCRPGDATWSEFHDVPRRLPEWPGTVCFEDLLFHEGMLYALTMAFEIWVFEFGPDGPRLSMVHRPVLEGRCQIGEYCAYYLVRSAGGFLLVQRDYDSIPPKDDGKDGSENVEDEDDVDEDDVGDEDEGEVEVEIENGEVEEEVEEKEEVGDEGNEVVVVNVEVEENEVEAENEEVEEEEEEDEDEEEDDDDDDDDKGDDDDEDEEVEEVDDVAKCWWTETVFIHVFRLDESQTKWVRIKSLGDEMLFVGSGWSGVLPDSNSPAYVRNRIYYTDDFRLQVAIKDPVRFDYGVFSLDRGPIPICTFDFVQQPPLWYMLGA